MVFIFWPGSLMSGSGEWQGSLACGMVESVHDKLTQTMQWMNQFVCRVIGVFCYKNILSSEWIYKNNLVVNTFF